MHKTVGNRAIKFHYLKSARLPGNALRKVIRTIFKRFRKRLGNLNYVFCSDAYLLKMNKTYLNHDYYTDILTFDLSDSSREISADIFISVDRVRQNAKSRDIPVSHELIRVALHGALHLAGYSDATKKGSGIMRIEEDRYLQRVLKAVPRETKSKK